MSQEVNAQDVINVLIQRIAQLELEKAVMQVQLNESNKSELSEG